MENQESITNNLETHAFKDGNFSFWEGEVEGEIVVIRVREDDMPSRRWVEKGLPPGMTIHPANDEHVRQWLDGHPKYELNK